MTDYEINRKANLLPIKDIASKLNISEEKRLSMIDKMNHTNKSKSKEEQVLINQKRSKSCKEFWNKS